MFDIFSFGPSRQFKNLFSFLKKSYHNDNNNNNNQNNNNYNNNLNTNNSINNDNMKQTNIFNIPSMPLFERKDKSVSIDKHYEDEQDEKMMMMI